jgi:hypothetical protein
MSHRAAGVGGRRRPTPAGAARMPGITAAHAPDREPLVLSHFVHPGTGPGVRGSTGE